jgi:hypothetical protein
VELDNHHLATYMYDRGPFEESVEKQIDFLKRGL